MARALAYKAKFKHEPLFFFYFNEADDVPQIYPKTNMMHRLRNLESGHCGGWKNGIICFFTQKLISINF
jgi:hypothetical protein